MKHVATLTLTFDEMDERDLAETLEVIEQQLDNILVSWEYREFLEYTWDVVSSGILATLEGADK